MWWYALTLNEDYRKICQQYDKSAPKLDTHTEREIVMRRVFSDFGDVRYEGCRYKAFAKWWTNRVNTNETRGVYLFAEPYNDTNCIYVYLLIEIKIKYSILGVN